MNSPDSNLISPNPLSEAPALLAVILFLSLPRPSGFAGEVAAGVTGAEPESSSFYDDIWSLATIYENDNDPFLQKLVFTGRFQFEYADVDSDQGDYNDWIVRRWRMGLKAKLFENFTLHSEAGLNPQTDNPFYRRLTDTYIAWSQDPSLVVKVGKQSAQFTLDGHTSSKKLITIDRSNLSNNLWFPQEYMPGISAGGEIDNWRYFSGFFWSGSRSPEFGNFDAGHFGLFSLGYEFAECLDVEQALLNFDYLYNDPHPGNTFTRSLRQVASVNFFYDTGKWGLRTDVSAGDSYGTGGNLAGFLVMPFYNITEKLQVVGRYTHISGDDGMNGVRLARYENRAVSGRGDDYDEFFCGLNYYFYGHKLKWQTGMTYAMMDDDAGDGGAYDGWGITSGIRISW